MMIVSYRRCDSADALRSGLLSGEALVDGSELGWPETVKGLLERGQRLMDIGSVTGSMALASSAAMALGDFELGPALPDPGKILCVGLNYADHAAESGLSAPKVPELFAKYANCLIGPEAPIEIPDITHQVDYEAELAVIIGQRCRDVSVGDALAVVAGYAVFNDVSARDIQMGSSQWTAGKAIDTFGPLGPGITLRAEVVDVQALDIRTRVNGRLLQNGTTADMLYKVVDLIAYISTLMTLNPGDIIATGTPAGVGMARTPQVFLGPGDMVEVEIEGLGLLRNPVIKRRA